VARGYDQKSVRERTGGLPAVSSSHFSSTCAPGEACSRLRTAAKQAVCVSALAHRARMRPPAKCAQFSCANGGFGARSGPRACPFGATGGRGGCWRACRRWMLARGPPAASARAPFMDCGRGFDQQYGLRARFRPTRGWGLTAGVGAGGGGAHPILREESVDQGACQRSRPQKVSK
jgi:hypothetical protein